jgi:hypothetical protein
MKFLNFLLLFSIIFLTGCSSESISDRLYTQAVGLTCDGRILSFFTEDFNQNITVPVEGLSITEVLRQEESANGGKIFIGHTELLCLDGTCTLNPAEELLFENGLSPACKILYAKPEEFFKTPDNSAMIHTIRMSEQNGLLSTTELASALNEWHGIWETALLPVQKENQTVPSLVFLHKDGKCKELSDSASKGMYWLRRNSGNFHKTLETPEGEKDIFIKNCRTEKFLKNQEIYYHVIIRTDKPELNSILQSQVEQQCQDAVREMLSAKADVTGIQDLLESHGIQPEKDMKLKIRLIVTIN